jgi:ATP-binding cassette subfamily B protein
MVRDLDRLLESAGVRPARREQVRSVMLRERLAAQAFTECWMLRLPATAPFMAQLSQAGLIRRLGRVAMLLTAVYLVEIGAGPDRCRGAGRQAGPRLARCVAVDVAVGHPLRLSAGWLEATFALDLGRILKRRLLAGALRINIDAVRHQGAGQIIGRVMESQALVSLMLGGGMAVIVAGCGTGVRRLDPVGRCRRIPASAGAADLAGRNGGHLLSLLSATARLVRDAPRYDA